MSFVTLERSNAVFTYIAYVTLTELIIKKRSDLLL